jgi:hypothetical protein
LLQGAVPGRAQDAPKREHPYLYFRQDELEKIRRRFRQPPQSYYLEALVREADHGKRVADRQLWAYLLTGRKEYRDKCMQWVSSEWNRNDFGQEWIGFKVNIMATVYDTLYRELGDAEKARMKGYLERALDAHLKKMGSWFYNNPSNTVPTQGGAAGMSALALLWESPKAPDAVTKTRRKLARYAARCLSDDGGYIEGTLYWSFGLSFYLGFAHADHNTTGNDELLNAPKLRKQYRFAETLLGGDGQFMTFNDTQPWLCAWAVCADLGRRYENELLLWLADHMAAIKAGKIDAPDIHVGHNYPPWAYVMLTQSDPGPARKPKRKFPGVPTLTYLERMQWGVMRSSADYVPDLVVGVKGSEGPLSHHKQKDLGSFVLYAQGEMLLLDPGYFQSGADCHSLPLIDGHGPRVSGSRITGAWEQGAWRAMSVDSTRAYGSHARRVRRTLVMAGDRAVVVLDDVVPARQGATITAQYQAAHEAQAEGAAAVVAAKRCRLCLRTFGPELKLDVRRRDFGKSWRYATLAREGKVAWHSIAGQYAADPARPLVTVLTVGDPRGQPAKPTCEHGDGTIEVKLSPRVSVEFRRADEGWTFVRPSDDEVARPATAGRRPRPTPKPTPTTRPRPTPKPRSRPKLTDAQRAASRLGLARSYLSNNMPDMGRRILRGIVRDWPDTPAAKEARELLKTLR